MERKTFVEAVIEQAHQATLRGTLEWHVDSKQISATLLEPVRVSIAFKDKGVDGAEWEVVNITHPVGQSLTSVAKAGYVMERHCDFVATGGLLQQLDEIFERVVVAPRQKRAAEVLAAITGRKAR